MHDEVLSSVLRGAGLSDLPAAAELATLEHPTLILAWDTDPLHPVSTAEQLHALLPGSILHIARTVSEVQTWTQRAARFFED